MVPVLAALLTLLALASSGCKKKCPACVDKSKPELDKCTTRADNLQKQVNNLKTKLAQALQDPTSVKVDPSVLTINGKPIKVAKGTGGGGGGFCKLTKNDIISPIAKSKGSLQPCYNRALKRYSTLHHRKLVLTLALKVRGNGSPTAIKITPGRYAEMNRCMRKAIKRWRWKSVGAGICPIVAPMTFVPKR